MIFATVGDSGFYKTMVMNARSIGRLHPGALFYVGDVGLSDKELASLDNETAIIKRIDVGASGPLAKVKKLSKLIFVIELMALSAKPVCFFDGDAVLVRKMDLDPGSHDAIVTTRKMSNHGRINSGFFIANNIDFVETWLLRAIAQNIENPGEMTDQPSLIELCDSNKFNVKEVPCEQYNYVRVEEGIPDDVRVVHLKKDRLHMEEMRDEVNKLIK